MSASHYVTCPRCGLARDPALAGDSGRPPCPNCGTTSLHISVSVTESIGHVADSVSVRLTPGQQARDWRQRWIEIKTHEQNLQKPRIEQLSAVSIHSARHDLHSFYVQAYHLKDSLIQDAATTGVNMVSIEGAIKQNATLSLLADLANLDKHGKLTRPPRSGSTPSIKQVAADSSGNTGWRLLLEISHQSKTLDGLQVAADVVREWDKQLKAWGLI